MNKPVRLRNSQRGALIHVVLGIGLVVLVVVVVGSDMASCSGTCASVTCTSDAPCLIDTNGDGVIDQCTSGTACAAGVLGTVCEDNWWPAADCVCANASRTPGQCAAGGFKP